MQVEFLKKEKNEAVKIFLLFSGIALLIPLFTFFSFLRTSGQIDWKNVVIVTGVMYSPIYIVIYLLYKLGYKIPGMTRDIQLKKALQIEATIIDAFSANFQPKFDFFRNPRKKPYYKIKHTKYKKIYTTEELFNKFSKGETVRFTIAENTGLALNIEPIK
jgi:hypothetical protein